jgi:preprotein translocase subunit SecG
MYQKLVTAVLFVSSLVACGDPRSSGSGSSSDGGTGSDVSSDRGVTTTDEWDGTYTGPLTSSGTCSDGTMYPTTTQSIGFTFTQRGATISYATACDVIAIADVSGNTATIRPYSCPPRMSGTRTIQVSVTGGVLTLLGNSVSANFLTRTTVTSSGIVNECNITVSGTLTRL